LFIFLGKNTYGCSGAVDPRDLKLVTLGILLPAKEIKEDFEQKLAGRSTHRQYGLPIGKTLRQGSYGPPLSQPIFHAQFFYHLSGELQKHIPGKLFVVDSDVKQAVTP
jgi:hypothetical protein